MAHNPTHYLIRSALMQQRGFTLIELLIVIAIIGLDLRGLNLHR